MWNTVLWVLDPNVELHEMNSGESFIIWTPLTTYLKTVILISFKLTAIDNSKKTNIFTK